MEKTKLQLLKQVAKNPTEHQAALKRFQEVFTGLQVGEYSGLTLQEIISNVGTGKIEDAFRANASDQLEKSGISSPLLKANLLKGCDEVLAQFNAAIEGLIQSAIAANKKADFDRITSEQMLVHGIYVAANCIRDIYPSYKILQIGRVSGGLVTKCNKSFDLDTSIIRIDNNADTYYLYAKWPRSGGMATLTVSTEPKANTDEHLFIFWQKGTFNEIKI